jgi:hypothetical protein
MFHQQLPWCSMREVANYPPKYGYFQDYRLTVVSKGIDWNLMGNKDKRGQSCTRPSSPHQDIKLTKSTVGAGTTSEIVKVIELNNPQTKEESKGTNYHFNLLTKP